jgi:hypothetical protein
MKIRMSRRIRIIRRYRCVDWRRMIHDIRRMRHIGFRGLFDHEAAFATSLPAR